MCSCQKTLDTAVRKSKQKVILFSKQGSGKYYTEGRIKQLEISLETWGQTFQTSTTMYYGGRPVFKEARR